MTKQRGDLIENQERFLESKWMQQANQHGAEEDVQRRYQSWSTQVNNPALLSRAGKLWRLMTSPSIGGKEKATVIAGLIYLISPLDFIPDFIPVIGWLDDLGIAAYVLSYVMSKADELPDDPELGDAVKDSKVVVGDLRSADLSQFASIGVAESMQNQSRYLDDLRKVCQLLHADTLLPSVDAIESLTNQPLFRVMFVGRYNAGKSTLLNRLLGDEYLLPGSTPTTKALTYIMAGESPQLTSQHADGRLTLHEDISDLKDRGNQAIAEAERVSLLLPVEILRSGICLIDTPGIEDPNEDTTRTMAIEVQQSEAVVLMLDATLQIGRAEQQFIKNMMVEDRARKLFVVVNKTDKVDSDRVSSVLESIRTELKKLDVQPRVFPLAAKSANGHGEDDGVAAFREALASFLSTGRDAEQQRIVGHQIRSLAGQLITAAKTQTALAEMESAEKEKQLSVLRDSVSQMNEVISKKQDDVKRLIERLEDGLRADFEEFCKDLESTVCRQIDESTLEQLRKSDLIERLIHQEIRSFLEPRLERIQEELGGAATDAVRGAVAELQRNRIQLAADNSKLLLEDNPEVVSAAVLVFSFSFLGMFTTLYLLAGLCFGRNVFEGLIQTLMSTVALGKVKSELKSKIREKLSNYRVTTSENLHEQFVEVSRSVQYDIATTVRATHSTEESILALNEQSACVSPDDVADAKQTLSVILRGDESITRG